MKQMKTMMAVVAVMACAATGAAPKRPAEPTPPVSARTLQRAFFDYDPKLPLHPVLEEMPSQTAALAALRTRYHLVYDSAHDQKVTAIYAVPKRFAAPYPAVVLLAGSGGNKDTDYIRIAADMFSTLGYATISIDSQYHGERARPERTGDFHLITNPTNRDAWVQTVIDLRRAVDFLRSRPEIDMKRIGFLGFSQGSMAGGTFLGLEPRVTCACLAVPGGGLVAWAKKLGFWSPAVAKEIEVNAAICDPIYYIGGFSGRPILFLSATHDEMIPRWATMALYNATGEPKQIAWFNSGHVIPPQALMITARAFFIKHLGARKETAAQ